MLCDKKGIGYGSPILKFALVDLLVRAGTYLADLREYGLRKVLVKICELNDITTSNKNRNELVDEMLQLYALQTPSRSSGMQFSSSSKLASCRVTTSSTGTGECSEEDSEGLLATSMHASLRSETSCVLTCIPGMASCNKHLLSVNEC